MNKQVIIMRGLPGSGKSHKVKELVEDARLRLDAHEVVICSADDFFMVWDAQQAMLTYKFDPTKLGEAHARCFHKYTVALFAGTPLVIVDNTNSQKWEFEHYQAVARLAGYECETEFGTDQHHESKHIRIDDVRRFAARNVHGVPLAAVAAMAARWED